MPLLADTRNFLNYLQKHRELRDRIKAGRDKTILYAGDGFPTLGGTGFTPNWRQLQDHKQRLQDQQREQPSVVETLHDVQTKLPAPPPNVGTLQSYAEKLAEQEKRTNGARAERVIWRALSGIFASIAQGKVWFLVGSHVDPDTKVFALTEVHVLRRNPNISPESKDMLEYYVRCVQRRDPDISGGYLPSDLLAG
jgi:hypothetical protein